MGDVSAMSQALKVACVQVSPGEDMDANLAAATDFVARAAADGARLVALPEHVAFLHASGRAMREAAYPETDHPALATFRETAARCGVHLLVGSLTIRLDERLANRSFLIDDHGAVRARYDKIHMFDAVLPTGREIRESRAFRPGSSARLADTPWGPLGLTICYDVRFPQLYRALAAAGAQILTIPAAFTAETGAAHWHTLVRARAIETGAFVLAPATCGTHAGGNTTYGHSLIVDPWGEVCAEGGDTPQVVAATLDLAAVAQARTRLPTLGHDRPFQVEGEPSDQPPRR